MFVGLDEVYAELAQWGSTWLTERCRDTVMHVGHVVGLRWGCGGGVVAWPRLMCLVRCVVLLLRLLLLLLGCHRDEMVRRHYSTTYQRAMTTTPQLTCKHTTKYHLLIQSQQNKLHARTSVHKMFFTTSDILTNFFLINAEHFCTMSDKLTMHYKAYQCLCQSPVETYQNQQQNATKHSICVKKIIKSIEKQF